jgi:hypothetical protein
MFIFTEQESVNDELMNTEHEYNSSNHPGAREAYTYIDSLKKI